MTDCCMFVAASRLLRSAAGADTETEKSNYEIYHFSVYAARQNTRV